MEEGIDFEKIIRRGTTRGRSLRIAAAAILRPDTFGSEIYLML